VSKQWKLIRYENGESTDVASNVLWFDLDASGQPYFTDGYSLYDAAGSKQLTAEEMISSVAVA
jgi:hypothetical protein